MSEFKELNDNTFTAEVENTQEGIVLFYKELCPHCKNMEKVLEKFSAKNPEVHIMRINLEENPQASQTAGAERPPTLVLLKNKAIVAKKAGLMNPKELQALFEAA